MLRTGAPRSTHTVSSMNRSYGAGPDGWHRNRRHHQLVRVTFAEFWRASQGAASNPLA